MVERILGIDLGIASLGWSVIEHDKENIANNKIIDCGVRLFTAAQTPKKKNPQTKQGEKQEVLDGLLAEKKFA